MHRIRDLACEIEKIVSVPYPATLTPLHHILNKTECSAIELWAQIKPCQTCAIIECLARRVRSDDLALPILLKLIRSPTVLRTILCHHPELLSKTCESALSELHEASERTPDSSKSQPYAQKIELFSSLLILCQRDDFSLPESFSTLAKTLIRGHSDETTSHWLRRTLAFFTNSQHDVLSLLSETCLVESAQRWKQLIRSSDHFDAMSAVYVASKLRKDALSTNTKRGSFTSPASQNPALTQWQDKCQALFKIERAFEVINATVLRILKFVSEDRLEVMDRVTGAIGMGYEILHEMEPHIIAAWSSKNMAVVRKLAQKITNQDVASVLRIASFCILSVLDPPKIHTGQTLELVSKHFTDLDTTTLPLNQAFAKEMVDNLLHTGQGSATNKQSGVLLRGLVEFILEQCQPYRTPTYDHALALLQATAFTNAIFEHLHRSGAAVIQPFLDALSHSDLPDWWTADPPTPTDPGDCQGSPCCMQTLEVRRQELCGDISLLCMHASHSRGLVAGGKLLQQIRQRLHKKTTLDGRTCCTHPFVATSQNFPITQASIPAGGDWRSFLKGQLSRSNNEVQALIEGVIEHVCRDLQERCDNIEAPLRQATREAQECRGRTTCLETNLLESHNQVAHLEEVVRKERGTISELSARTEELELLENEMREELNLAKQSEASLRNEMARLAEECTHSVAAGATKAQEDIARIEDEYMMKMNEIKDSLQSLSRDLQGAQHENSWLREQTEVVKDELATEHTKKHEELEIRHQDEVAHLHTKISDLEDLRASIATDMRAMQSDLDARQRTLADFRNRHSEQNTRIESLTGEIQFYQSQVTSLETELAKANKKNAAFIEQQRATEAENHKHLRRTSELEKTLSSWQQQCAAQEEALTKARKVEKGMLAILQGNISSGQTPAMQCVGKDPSTPTPRLPEGSFISEEGEDYDEILQLDARSVPLDAP